MADDGRNPNFPALQTTSGGPKYSDWFGNQHESFPSRTAAAISTQAFMSLRNQNSDCPTHDYTPTHSTRFVGLPSVQYPDAGSTNPPAPRSTGMGGHTTSARSANTGSYPVNQTDEMTRARHAAFERELQQQDPFFVQVAHSASIEFWPSHPSPNTLAIDAAGQTRFDSPQYNVDGRGREGGYGKTEPSMGVSVQPISRSMSQAPTQGSKGQLPSARYQDGCSGGHNEYAVPHLGSRSSFFGFPTTTPMRTHYIGPPSFVQPPSTYPTGETPPHGATTGDPISMQDGSVTVDDNVHGRPQPNLPNQVIASLNFIQAQTTGFHRGFTGRSHAVRGGLYNGSPYAILHSSPLIGRDGSGPPFDNFASTLAGSGALESLSDAGAEESTNVEGDAYNNAVVKASGTPPVSAHTAAAPAVAHAQGQPNRLNTRHHQNNIIGRMNNGSNYGADVRGRAPVQAQPPLGIDISAVEINTFYPNALQHPAVAMRLTKAGWSKKDLAKAQLHATGNLTRQKLKTSEDRIQKQIGAGGKAYCGLERGDRWSKADHLEGTAMFDDLTADDWSFRHHHDPSYDDLSFEDVPLASLFAHVANWPQNADRLLLTRCLEYASANSYRNFTTADFDQIIQSQNFQVAPHEDSTHDVQALEGLRQRIPDP